MFLPTSTLTFPIKTDEIIQSIEQHILDVYRETSTLLSGLAKSSPLLHALLASGNSALYTALVYITSSRKLDVLFPLHYVDYMHCSTDITRLNDNSIPFETPPRNTPIVDVCSASMRLHPSRSSCAYASGPSNLFYPLIVSIKVSFPG